MTFHDIHISYNYLPIFFSFSFFFSERLCFVSVTSASESSYFSFSFSSRKRAPCHHLPPIIVTGLTPHHANECKVPLLGSHLHRANIPVGAIRRIVSPPPPSLGDSSVDFDSIRLMLRACCRSVVGSSSFSSGGPQRRPGWPPHPAPSPD